MLSGSSFGTQFLAVVLFIAPLSAQQPVDRWRIEVEAGLNGASGNSSYAILRTGGKVVLLQKQLMEFEASGLIRYGKNDEKVIADDATTSLKLGLWPQETWSPFVFGDWSRDAIRKLDARASGGLGVKYLFWSGEKGKASLSAAALFDYQNYRVAPGSTDPETEKRARWSVRHMVERKLSEGATFEQVIFYQPVWNKAGDYVADVTNSVTTKVLGKLSLGVEHQYLRDATPQPGVGSDDQKFSVILTMSF
jgi:hypothetical protein